MTGGETDRIMSTVDFSFTNNEDEAMMTLRKPRLNRLPKVGDKVTPVGKSVFVADLKGLVGKVVDILHGACGPIVAVQFAERPGQTYDLFWKKVRAA